MNIIHKIWKILYYLQLSLFIIGILLAVVLISKPDYFVQRFAEFLVVESNPEPSDLIIVLGGNEREIRIAEGFRLYDEGYADKIIFSGMDSTDSLVEQVSSRKPINASVETQSQSTYENATILEPYFEGLEINSVILVTAPAQSRRAKKVFEQVYKDVTFTVSISQAHSYDAALIFDDKQIRENFTSEGMKYLYYLLKYGIWF